ncbi:MAG: response regulator containing a CheY-like receiver domain and an DNA-binding domain [Pedosphaera sp.]|nr:response regulator containing a CheY-like receiver domain and an DNA-binding domain [Pedosphaera sp.]
MKKVLFVEDNALIASIYSNKLSEAGFEVRVAEDGLVAMKLLLESKPDLVVLDLLMPKMTGVDVLKFMREHEELKSVRVVVFSNSFLSNLAEQAVAMRVEKALIKAAVTPARLIDVINQMLDKPGEDQSAPKKAAAPDSAVEISKPEREALAREKSATAANQSKSGPQKENASKSETLTMMGRQFLELIPALSKELRQLCRDFLEASASPDQTERLIALNRKLGFLTQMAAIAGYHRTAELASALEALLYELLNKPEAMNDSSRHTVAASVAFLADRFDPPEAANEQERPSAKILIVDDDVVSNRALAQALGRAKLSATSEASPLAALTKLEQSAYDVVLMDITMPEMDGLVLCEKMRSLPLHKRTPVIFVTSHTDLKTRVQSILSGGNDFISKPISPAEVCVKVITCLLKTG